MTAALDPADATDTAAREALGAALSVLRVRAQLTQAQAGEAFGASGQGWSKYETGKAPSIFQPSVQARLAQAVGADRDELLNEAQRHAARLARASIPEPLP